MVRTKKHYSLSIFCTYKWKVAQKIPPIHVNFEIDVKKMPFLLLTCIFVLSLILIKINFNRKRYYTKSKFSGKKKKKLIAFFHPHCSAGGGGERVLWKAIQALGEIYNEGIDIGIAIYTCDSYHETYAFGKLL
jgi:hypothetical protein